ncbi:MAG: efflux RND transporter periplasmic adaptor subunit [Betaproteobacteria bacterium]|nr:efflux RND transporter periplasmic adaptor subunit [Betaproteobacteria bacterium]
MNHASDPALLRPGRALRGAAMVLAVCAALAACGRHDAQQAPAAPRSVAAATVVIASAQQAGTVQLPGTVVSRHSVQVASRLSGFIRDLRVDEGQRVRAGQVLFEVDAPELRAQTAQAQAQVAQARAELTQSDADERRYGDLYRAEAIPRQQWEQVQLRARVARQQLAAATAAASGASAQWPYATVRSPIDGVVAQKLASAGDLASPGRAVLVIDGGGAPQVQVQLPQELFEHAHVGDTVQVRADARTLPARVASIVPVADAVARTHAAKLDLPADSGLSSGQYVQVDFPGAEQAQLRVPRAAVVQRAGMTGVFVVDTSGIAHFRLVRLGREQGAEADVQAGLRGGETLVVDHLDAVENDVRIVGVGRG